MDKRLNKALRHGGGTQKVYFKDESLSQQNGAKLLPSYVFEDDIMRNTAQNESFISSGTDMLQLRVQGFRQ